MNRKKILIFSHFESSKTMQEMATIWIPLEKIHFSLESSKTMQKKSNHLIAPEMYISFLEFSKLCKKKIPTLVLHYKNLSPGTPQKKNHIFFLLENLLKQCKKNK